MSQMQGLIRSFLWFVSDGSQARVKVAWLVIMLHIALEGLGLVDATSQSPALLGKFIVISLHLGGET